MFQTVACNFFPIVLTLLGNDGFSPSNPIREPELARRLAGRAEVSRDPALDASARLHARDILKDSNRAQWKRVKQALRKEGIADAQFWPVAVYGSQPRALIRDLLAASERQGAVRGATHVGLGVAREGPRWAIVALFVRRLVRISPLPTTPAPNGLLIRGRTDEGADLEALWMGPCQDTECVGPVRNLTLRRGQTGWSTEVPPMRGDGVWTLELMVTTERGPEPAVLWRFGSDEPSAPPFGPPRTWVANLRARHRLPPLQNDRQLTLAARRHARKVCEQRQAAHILAGEPTPEHRALDAGYLWRVTENVAVAPTAAAAHRDLLRSPSHRRNVLDPSAVHYGMAVLVAPARPGTRPIRCWVELFGHPHR